jgi:hypothetical protein
VREEEFVFGILWQVKVSVQMSLPPCEEPYAKAYHVIAIEALLDTRMASKRRKAPQTFKRVATMSWTRLYSELWVFVVSRVG